MNHCSRSLFAWSALIVLTLCIGSPEAASAFRLDPLKDSFLAGTGLALSVTSLALQLRSSSGTPPPPCSRIPAIDEWARSPYSRGQDLAGDLTTACAAFSVASLVPGSTKDRLTTYGVMYLESLLFSFGIENSMKSLVTRRRPFTYCAGAPARLYEGNDHLRSFPSAHTTLAFTGAAFASYVFCQENPDSRRRVAVVGGSLLFATGTAVLRVSSGNHFPTDVLAAAAIGTASGLLVPMAHLKREGRTAGRASSISMAVDPANGALTLTIPLTTGGFRR